MSRGSVSSCFCVTLVARKNISLVSLWALLVSISGALLVAREYKTLQMSEKKIKGRSKALRMCPLMNVHPLSTALHMVSKQIRICFPGWDKS